MKNGDAEQVAQLQLLGRERVLSADTKLGSPQRRCLKASVWMNSRGECIWTRKKKLRRRGGLRKED